MGTRPFPASVLIVGSATQLAINSVGGSSVNVGAGFNVVVAAQWTDPQDTDRCVAWARDTYQALGPYLGTTTYMNYMDDEDADPAAIAYGPNLDRLRAVKRTYDPDNVFHVNVNVRPR